MVRTVTRRRSFYLNDLFYLAEMTRICNFADDSTFCVCDKDLNTLFNRLEHDTALASAYEEFIIPR